MLKVGAEGGGATRTGHNLISVKSVISVIYLGFYSVVLFANVWDCCLQKLSE